MARSSPEFPVEDSQSIVMSGADGFTSSVLKSQKQVRYSHRDPSVGMNVL